MNKQKQSRVDGLEKRMAAVTNVIQHMMNEVSQLKDLAVGTLETIKQMPDYEEAINKLKEKVAAEPGETEEANTDRKTFE